MKIISLSPSLTDIIWALQAEDQLVGVSNACKAARNTIERMGSPKAVQFSKIDSLSPDWILADAQDNRPEEIQRIERKWRTRVFNVRGVEAVRDAVAELGRITEKREEARRLNELLEKELRECEKTFQDRTRRKTALLLWDTPYLTVNFDTYASRLAEASGGVNVFREEPIHEFPVEMEDLIERNPELLLLSGEPAPFQKRHVTEFRRYRVFSRIPIHLIGGELLTRYGPQTLEALRSLRKIYGGLP